MMSRRGHTGSRRSGTSGGTNTKPRGQRGVHEAVTPICGHAPLVGVGEVGQGTLGCRDVQVEAEGAHEAEQADDGRGPRHLGVAEHGQDLEVVHADGHEGEVLERQGEHMDKKRLTRGQG